MKVVKPDKGSRDISPKYERLVIVDREIAASVSYRILERLATATRDWAGLKRNLLHHKSQESL